MKLLASTSRLVFAVSFVVSALAIGCSSSDGAISVDATGGALTDKPQDFLFTIKVDEGRTDGYALDGLSAKVKPDSGDAVTIVCTPKDANANTKLDQGETLACNEGATNAFDSKSVGKEATVQLYAKIDGKDELVGEATWTPK